LSGAASFGAEGAPHDGEKECGVDLLEGDAAIVEVHGQAPILGSEVSQGAGGAAVVVEDRLHVELAFHEFAQP
jgi:hypothetical protein